MRQVRQLASVRLALAALIVTFAYTRGATSQGTEGSTIRLSPCRVANVPAELRCGEFEVYENRATRAGRRLTLNVRVIPSVDGPPDAVPLVYVSPGGPGITNSDVVAGAYARGWRQDRDVVLVDLRGTSPGTRLDCQTPGSPEHPAGYLQSAFDSVVARECRSALEQRADLRQYTTHNVVEDLHDALVALGLPRVNLWGASGGTREVLEFVRHYPGMVRAAIVEGTVPVSFKNPLPHAAAAQEAMDSLFAQCARDTACASAYPHLRDEFRQLHDTLAAHAVIATMPSDLAGRDSTVDITWPMVAETVRVMSYTAQNARSIPFVVDRAARGDFGPLITFGVQGARSTRNAIRMGFLLSQTCSEDVPRITDAEIARVTAHTYLGDTRVRQQQAACRQWTRGRVAPSDLAPVRSDVPVLLLSGTIDPVTRPTFAVDAARYLTHSIHVVAPGGHTPNGPCIEAIERQFLATASAKGLDTSCVAGMTLPAFRLR